MAFEWRNDEAAWGQGRAFAVGDLTVDVARAAASAIIPLLANRGEAEINLAGVTRIDSAGFQLLVVLARTAARQGVALRFAEPSPDVRRILDLFRVDAEGGFKAGAARNV